MTARSGLSRGTAPGRGLWALLLGLLLTAGCTQPEPGKSDEVAVLALSEARAWQRRADLQLLDGDLAGAIGSVEEVTRQQFPAGMPEAEDIVLDAYQRLAKLHLSKGGEAAETQALAELAAGRKRATRDSFFLLHLESVAVDAYEARAERLSKAGADAAAVKQARREGIAAAERCIALAKKLQQALLVAAQRESSTRGAK